MKSKLVHSGFACLVALTALSGRGADDWVRFSADGSRLVAEVAGTATFQGVSSADYEVEGKVHRMGMGIDGCVKIEPVRETVGTTPFGEAILSTATFGAPGSPYHYTLTLKRLRSVRAFTLQAVFHNRSDQAVKFRSIDLLDLTKDAGGSLSVEHAADWLVTPLMESTPAASLGAMSQSLKEAAMVYRADGVGFLIGPVGPAEAYTTVGVRQQALKASVQMEGVLVRAGESRRGEEMIFCFEPPAIATSMWTRWVAATHGARLHKGPVYGWCSWYDRTTNIDAAHVLAATKTIEENPNVFGRGIVQIDDGYQKMDGDWSANEKFPEGMASLAKRIREAGCIPGVWFAPLMIHPDHPWAKANPAVLQANPQGMASFMNPNKFHPAGANWLKPDHPKAKEFLAHIITDARERGYGYIKIDFNGIGSRFLDPTKTRLQIFRELYALYRQAAGDDMYILSCLGQPTRGVIGFVDSARVGPDSHPAHFAKCLESVLRFQIFDGVWWQNDPDVSYLAPKLASRRVGHTPEGEGMWRTWHNVVGLVGGTAMISEPVDQPDVRQVWRNFEIMRPASAEPARLLTLGLSPHNSIFGFHARRPEGDFAVYNLYNSQAGARPLTLDFKAAGLPSEVRCAVYDFWADRVIGYGTNSYTTAPLATHSSALLRFTPLGANRPTLVGSNLHLSLGATEVRHLRVSETRVEIELTDAGAGSGSLVFYSEKSLAPAGAENCRVSSVAPLGDNLWRVSLADRQWGKSQSLALSLRN
jgi:alpha-galactosidase